ncbi:nucleotidyl transferase AbiEii/AbiGii toxin family protein [Glycomyces rhizosphaerae]|uniref:Nucleotidyl transferase AbiEii/AbiGii toxin family protein n=1 Tax=Glycomyces rhizosphaerae TaxID=2054422 RepID=A0ABV7Q0E2_9ACTN
MAWHSFDPETFEIGHTELELDEETVIGLYGPERSIIDAFRLRHLEGHELAVEALKRWLRRPGSSPATLLAMARDFPKRGPRCRPHWRSCCDRATDPSDRGGRVYLDLQNLARRDHRPTDELLQIYALEGFLARLAVSAHADRLDGLEFDLDHVVVETIRDEESNGVRIVFGARLSVAKLRLHVDINVGDPIWPGPQTVPLPRLLGGNIELVGYPLTMVLAEKLVTAIQRGTANTRWRDFTDV